MTDRMAPEPTKGQRAKWVAACLVTPHKWHFLSPNEKFCKRCGKSVGCDVKRVNELEYIQDGWFYFTLDKPK